MVLQQSARFKQLDRMQQRAVFFFFFLLFVVRFPGFFDRFFFLNLISQRRLRFWCWFLASVTAGWHSFCFSSATAKIPLGAANLGACSSKWRGFQRICNLKAKIETLLQVACKRTRRNSAAGVIHRWQKITHTMFFFFFISATTSWKKSVFGIMVTAAKEMQKGWLVAWQTANASSASGLSWSYLHR